MNKRLSFFLIQELGRRSNQEDTIYPSIADTQFVEGLFILCDGMGGHASGELASQLVCATLSEAVFENRREDGFFEMADFNKALNVAYDALDAHDYEEEKKMGTTLAFARFHKGGCFIAHIGDSRIYHIRPSEHKCMYVTRDHSLVNDLVELGELTPQEARYSARKNIITRAMQPHQDHRAKADTYNITDLKVDDILFLCSDGMLETIDDQQLLDYLSAPVSDEEKVREMREATATNQDNHSAILIHLLDDDRQNNNGHLIKKNKHIVLIIIASLILIIALIILFK